MAEPLDVGGPDTRHVRHPGALWRSTIGGVLVRPPGADESWHLTTPGDVVWDLLVEPCTLDELTETLAAEYGEPVATVRRDIEPILRTLHVIGAVRVC